MGRYAGSPKGAGNFLTHFASIQPDANGCMIWPLSKTPRGYGQASCFGGVWPAHRVIAHLHHGLDLDDAELFALHRCDVRACVNPDHIFVGTKGDNARDRDAKGRNVRGESVHTAKLSASDVLAIRARLAEGERTGDLAAEFSVTCRNVRAIREGRTWKHL